ncbi:MAG: hypothetical protein ABIF82_05340 [Planctomycetota bacterium]
MAAAATLSRSAPGGHNASWDDYRILLTRNMFARNRSVRPAERPAVAKPAPRSRGAHTFVLIGVTVRGDVRIAFFEDSQTGETVQTTIGRTVGAGTIVSIALDTVEYSSGGATRKISVGENLAGVAVTLSPPTASTSPAATTAPGAVAGSAGAADKGTDKSANDILERMRKRRLDEMKR